MIRNALIWAAAAATFLAVFAGTSFAGPTVLPTEDSSIRDLVAAIVDTFRGGDRVAAGALTLFATLALAKRYWTTGKVGRFLHSDTGGALTLFGMSFAGSVAAQARGPWEWSVLSTAWHVGVATAGGYVLIKRLVIDPIKRSAWYAKAPIWLKTALDAVTWIVDKPDAVAKATQAGADAVAANPSPGADGIAGPATKF
jgi:hypothetical protein